MQIIFIKTDIFKRYGIWFIPLILILWKVVYFLFVPIVGTDTSWSLSQTYAVLRGEILQSPLGHDYMGLFQLPYMYAVITAVSFILLPFGMYDFLVLGTIILFVQIGLVYYLLYRKGGWPLPTVLVIIVGLITNPYLIGMRPEQLILTLMIIILIWLHNIEARKHWSYSISLGIATTIVGLSHPIAGIFCTFFVLLVFIESRRRWQSFAIYLIAVAVSLLFLYGPVIFLDFRHWYEMMFVIGIDKDTHTFSPLGFFKYLIYSWPPFVIMVMSLWKSSCSVPAKLPFWVKEISIGLILVLLLSVFGRSYYFSYLTIYLLWRMMALKRVSLNRWLTACFICVSPFFSHYLPTLQIMDNLEYASNARSIIAQVDTYSDLVKNQTVRTNPTIVMPIIDEKGSRIHFSFYRRLAGYGMPFEPGDVILFAHPKDYENILRNLDYHENELQVREIIQPVPGLRTLDSFFQDRSDPLGLWELSIRNIP